MKNKILKQEILKNNFEKQFLEKNLKQIKKKKNWKKVGRKIILIFFCFECATQNKALDTMKLISNFFFPKEFMV